ncbi:hypothetical protein ACPUYX_09885 [Desulfosporosinus sp. SYSU MS00001]|uniref:hypothetical protein n=1 Tax=Desulfosporosinus sp. SYSU MS00001 TaxID=3416284 RepID=UPI003CE8C846
MVDIHQILDSDDSKVNFIKGLIYLSKAEELEKGIKGINMEELGYLNNAMVALNIDELKRKQLESLIYLNSIELDISFKSKRQAVFFLREGIQICCIDGQYSQAEKDLVYRMASVLGINKSMVANLEEWVSEGIEWSNRGEKFLELEG